MIGTSATFKAATGKITPLLPFAFAAQSIAEPLFFKKYDNPEEKTGAVGQGFLEAAISFSLAGRSFGTQLAGGFLVPALQMLMGAAQGAPSLATMGIDDRSMLATPFAYSSVNMSAAQSHFQFAQESMEKAYGSMQTNQARIFASRLSTR